jgi:4-amino-4-deoxy-L-arabinose transferase-like glycosyltransferase
MSNRITNLIAAILLVFMFLVAVSSIKEDSLTMDELAHLPAGYSYLTQQDMRLNPEHPPLIKDLAGFPLLFIKGIQFPSGIKDWQQDLNGQWGFGNIFLFKSGNPADTMIFWGRIPMILLMILLGFFLFKWARELFGNKVALLTLFFYSFSPTFLAHGRLVTTDVGAAFGVVLSTYYFLKFLQTSTTKNIILAGVTLAIAQLLKFSLILIYPFFVLTFLAWIIFKVERDKLKQLFSLGIKLAFVFIIGFLVIWPVYQFHVLNLPSEKISAYAHEFLSHHPVKKIIEKLPVKVAEPADIISGMAENPVLKPWSYYLLGIFMVTERAAGGNTTYFMGEVSAAGWAQYFPTVYLIKEPLAFHILTLIVIIFAIWAWIKKPFWRQSISRFKNWVKSHFTESVFLLWLIIYWGSSLASNLNIGVRHLLPTFPFTYMLVSAGIIAILAEKKGLGHKFIGYSVLIILVIWQAITVVAIYPHFLSYGNELIGGPKNLYKYTVDSNLDWGQDLKRLRDWVDEQGIKKIYVDYFGGADTKYYLGNKLISWQGDRSPSELAKGSYLAVSATFLQGGRGKLALGFSQPHGYYNWLDSYKPVKIIGNSIFIYQIK